MSVVLPSLAPQIPTSSALFEAFDHAGFTQVTAGGPSPTLDVVFVHGLQGHPRNTWTYQPSSSDIGARTQSRGLMYRIMNTWNPTATTGSRSVPEDGATNSAPPCFWPADLLPEDLPRARILTYGYDSDVSRFFQGPANQNNITANDRSFLHGLAACRKDDQYRPLLFIVHSLGGLVLKAALRKSENEPLYEDIRAIYKSPFAIIFFGTPHRGSAYANIGTTATKIAAASGFDTNTEILRSLKPNAEILELLREDFERILHLKSFDFTSFQESKGYKNIPGLHGKIVDNDSSGLDHVRERKDFINADHLNMCKFRSHDDQEYKKVRTEILRHTKQLLDSLTLERRKCLQSLYIVKMYERVEEIQLPSQYTLDWLLDAETGPGLERWLTSGKHIYWLKGRAGSGKSTAMKFLLKNPKTARLLSGSSGGLDSPADVSRWSMAGLFFTDRAEEVKKSWEGMLHAILHDLLKFHPRLIPYALPYGIQNGAESMLQDANPGVVQSNAYRWTIESLQEALRCCKRQNEVHFRMCFFIDALDEHAGDHRDMSNFLLELAHDSQNQSTNEIKLCIASRELTEFNDLFVNYPTLKMQNWTKHDIRHFVSERLKRHRRVLELLATGTSPQEMDDLVEDITEKSHGVFLWVRLVVDELDRGLTSGANFAEAQHLIQQLPDDLHAFYQRMIEKIRPKDRLKGFVMLESVLRARVPLTPVQLVLIAQFIHDGAASMPLTGHNNLRTSIDIEQLCDPRGLERQITACTGGLLEVKLTTEGPSSYQYSGPFSLLAGDTKGAAATREAISNASKGPEPSLQLLHQTVKEYLRQPGSMDTLLYRDCYDRSERPVPNGHHYILKFCQSFLKLSETQQASLRRQTIWNTKAEVEFHAIPAMEFDSEIWFSILDDIDRQLSYSFGQTAWTEVSTTLVEFAVQKGMDLYLNHVFKQKPHLIHNASGRRPLLHYAVATKSLAASLEHGIVPLLVRRGADPNIRYNDETTMERLIIADTVSGNAEQHVARALEMLKVLLSNGASPACQYRQRTLSYVVDGKIMNQWRPLSHEVATVKMPASELLDCLDVLLRHGVNPNERDACGFTLTEILYFTCVPFPCDSWSWLLQHGGRITLPMISRRIDVARPQIFTDPHSDQGRQYYVLPCIYDEIAREYCHESYHILRQAPFRKREYYTEDAASRAVKYNDDWDVEYIDEVNPLLLSLGKRGPESDLTRAQDKSSRLALSPLREPVTLPFVPDCSGEAVPLSTLRDIDDDYSAIAK